MTRSTTCHRSRSQRREATGRLREVDRKEARCRFRVDDSGGQTNLVPLHRSGPEKLEAWHIEKDGQRLDAGPRSRVAAHVHAGRDITIISRGRILSMARARSSASVMRTNGCSRLPSPFGEAAALTKTLWTVRMPGSPVRTRSTSKPNSALARLNLLVWTRITAGPLSFPTLGRNCQCDPLRPHVRAHH